jgi:DsbC/DsbD-like thiol-disulfide interchange protein
MRIPVLVLLLSSTLLAQNTPSLTFRGEQQSKHATIATAPPDATAPAGGKAVLFLDVTPKTGIHVYAPGSKDYIPITVKLTAPADLKAGKMVYPKAEMMTFGDERVPVFQKPFRLTQEVTLGKTATPGSTLNIAGTVNLQACDDKVCYPPETVPVSWNVLVK